jgi:S1-C subfamily serine protease
MNVRQVERSKLSIVKVQVTGSTYNSHEPYLQSQEYTSGGTGFFVPHSFFGPKFPQAEGNNRFLLTNFHVVQTNALEHVQVEWPERAQSYMHGKVLFCVPKIDVAVIMIDPSDNHPQWWADDVHEWLETIPNLPIETKTMVKGSNQSVLAIGYPNLCDDRHISNGYLCSRGLGMLQVDISFNGGNSGGPLFLKSKVVGICTASLEDTERLGLAIPIAMVYNFFARWTNFKGILLKTPSYGIEYRTLTKDYLGYHKIDQAYQGALVRRVVKNSAADKKIMKGDIVMGIAASGCRFNVNCFAKIKTGFSDVPVEIDDLELLLQLSGDIFVTILRDNKTLKIKIKPKPLDFKVRTVFPMYETVPYHIFGGCCYMNLSLNHLTEEDEDECTTEYDTFTHLLSELKSNVGLHEMVVVTSITPQSHIDVLDSLQLFEEVTTVNGTKINGINHLGSVFDKIALEFESGQIEYMNIETSEGENIFSLESLQAEEMKDAIRGIYPMDKLRLIPMNPAIKPRTKRRRLSVSV